MFSPKQNNKQEKAPNKPKQFQLMEAEVSELSFIVNNFRTFEEVLAYWQQRKIVLTAQIEGRCGLKAGEYDVDWGQVFSTGCIFAHRKPKPEIQEVRVDVQPDKNGKPELPKKPDKGVSGSN